MLAKDYKITYSVFCQHCSLLCISMCPKIITDVIKQALQTGFISHQIILCECMIECWWLVSPLSENEKWYKSHGLSL